MKKSPLAIAITSLFLTLGTAYATTVATDTPVSNPSTLTVPGTSNAATPAIPSGTGTAATPAVPGNPVAREAIEKGEKMRQEHRLERLALAKARLAKLRSEEATALTLHEYGKAHALKVRIDATRDHIMRLHDRIHDFRVSEYRENHPLVARTDGDRPHIDRPHIVRPNITRPDIERPEFAH